MIRLRKTASVLFRLATRRDNEVAVADHKGQVRNLFPLPWSRTLEGSPSCKLAIVNLAT